MTSLVFVTQAASRDHPVLGATLAKIRELASRVDEVLVLAASVDPEALPANCSTHSFAAPTQALRGARYLAALAPALARRPVAVVAHMSPVFAVLAAPLAKPLRVPLLLWFAQQATTGRTLAVAERAVDAILSVDARSVPLASPKVRAIGHGIDVGAFPCGAERRPPLRRLLGLGRYAPVKEWPTLLRAAAELDARVTIHGPGDPGELRRLAHDLGVEAAFGSDVPHRRVPELFAEADALVNTTRGASADKVVYEAAAACLPVFAASPVFDAFLPSELRFPAGDHHALAARVRGYAGGAGPALRARVEAEHSAAHWAEQVLEAAGA